MAERVTGATSTEEAAELAERVAAAAKGDVPTEAAEETGEAPEPIQPVRDGEGFAVAETQAEAPEGERKLTRYVVLEAVAVKRGEDSEELWRVVGEAGQFEGAKALDQAHAALGREHGALVAIPVRSWKPKRPVEKPRPPVVGWE